MNYYSYEKLLNRVLKNGIESDDRTGTGTLSVFGERIEYDLQEGFPLITTKKVNIDSITSELQWFLEGSTNERRLAEIHYGDTWENLIGKKTIWTANADNEAVALGYENNNEVKDLGPVYGRQWRSWPNYNGDTVDQIKNVIERIKTNPNCRRLIVSAWNVAQIEQMALPPCHLFFQFYVRQGKLSCQVYIRSNDLFLGAPFNIASYALLLSAIAEITGLIAHRLIIVIGDAHIYLNHVEQVKEQLQRKPYPFPKLILNKEIKNIDDFNMRSFYFRDYQHHPAIKAPMAFQKTKP